MIDFTDNQKEENDADELRYTPKGNWHSQDRVHQRAHIFCEFLFSQSAVFYSDSVIHGSSLQGAIANIADSSSAPNVAALTCDIEQDFGGRIGTCELLEDRTYMDELMNNCTSLNIPLSGFIVTDILQKKYGILDSLRDHSIDLHAHSALHDTKNYHENSAEEIRDSYSAFTSYFGHAPLGYRAPQGVLYREDIDVLKSTGYQFSASVFPAQRRGKFDYRSLPQIPWKWSNGLLELPFGTAGKKRTMITISYLKLYGLRHWKRLLSNTNALPPLVIIDSHLHDFFRPSRFSSLPLIYRLAYSRNQSKGFALLTWLVEELRNRGYTFTTMSSLASSYSHI